MICLLFPKLVDPFIALFFDIFLSDEIHGYHVKYVDPISHLGSQSKLVRPT